MEKENFNPYSSNLYFCSISGQFLWKQTENCALIKNVIFHSHNCFWNDSKKYLVSCEQLSRGKEKGNYDPFSKKQKEEPNRINFVRNGNHKGGK